VKSSGKYETQNCIYKGAQTHPQTLSKDACVDAQYKANSIWNKHCQKPQCDGESPTHSLRLHLSNCMPKHNCNKTPGSERHTTCAKETQYQTFTAPTGREKMVQRHADWSCCSHQMGGQRRNCSCAGRASCCTYLNKFKCRTLFPSRAAAKAQPGRSSAQP
jgi:hypothetical protein